MPRSLARDAGSGCRHLAAHMCSVVMLAAATIPESVPIPEANRPFSEPQFPHLATLPPSATQTGHCLDGQEAASVVVY